MPGEHCRLLEQLESAVASISMNIVEGKGRNSKKQFIQFPYMARSSLYEAITLLTIFKRREWITNEKFEKFEKVGEEIASMIKGLINSINRSRLVSVFSFYNF